MTYSGKLALVVGTSGSGKGALLKQAKKLHPEIVFPVSCTTRAMRPHEREGDTYYFLTRDEFTARVDAGEFIEWAEYGGNLYGTLSSQILEPLSQGKLIVREVEVQGARQIRDQIPAENLSIIYIYAGPWSVVERRIVGRAPISEEELALRKEHYQEELLFKEKATYVINNFDGKFSEADAAFDRTLCSLVPSAA